jgi:hypothetical protein
MACSTWCRYLFLTSSKKCMASSIAVVSVSCCVQDVGFRNESSLAGADVLKAFTPSTRCLPPQSPLVR